MNKPIRSKDDPESPESGCGLESTGDTPDLDQVPRPKDLTGIGILIEGDEDLSVVPVYPPEQQKEAT